MEKYLELLEWDFTTEASIKSSKNLDSLESSVFEALFKNNKQDQGKYVGIFEFELQGDDILEVVSEVLVDEITIEDIAIALMRLEKKKYINIDFERAIIRFDIKLL